MTVLHSYIVSRSDTFAANRAAMEAAIAEVEATAARAMTGGGPAAMERHVKRGKPPPRRRVEQLLDPGSPFVEVGLFAGHSLRCPEAIRRHPGIRF